MDENKINDISELKSYEKHFSEPGFWGKIGKVALKAGRDVVRLALILFYLLKSPNVSTRDKAIIVGALGYFILPIDLIPDALPMLGFTDDFAALALAYKAISSNVTPDITAQADAKLGKWFD